VGNALRVVCIFISFFEVKNMPKSMTGFGRGEYENLGIEYTVEIKSVNHRYYDLNIRLPRQYSFLEDVIRKEVALKFSRGKIDVNVSINDFKNSLKKVSFNEEVIKAYMEEAKTLEETLGLKNNFAFSNILNIPDAVSIEKDDNQENVINDFKKSLFIAFDNLTIMKAAEGNNLKENIILKIERMEELFIKIEERASLVVNEYRDKLKARVLELTSLSEVSIDETRLATEVAIFADKACIDEEITRFKSHIKQILSTLELNESIGKKLDFIIQEMNREVNTIGSKSTDLTITNTVIELKNILEQIREQIQNIE